MGHGQTPTSGKADRPDRWVSQKPPSDHPLHPATRPCITLTHSEPPFECLNLPKHYHSVMTMGHSALGIPETPTKPWNRFRVKGTNCMEYPRPLALRHSPALLATHFDPQNCGGQTGESRSRMMSLAPRQIPVTGPGPRHPPIHPTPLAAPSSARPLLSLKFNPPNRPKPSPSAEGCHAPRLAPP
jgi:hypothetical protein